MLYIQLCFVPTVLQVLIFFFRKTKLYSVLDKSDLQNITWSLQVPHHLAVTNTERAKLLFNADLLGSTIEVFCHLFFYNETI